jgi:hypothetical protein
MPDSIAVAAGLGASFAAASVLFATWEIRRARESVSSSYRLGNETALVAELGIEPNELRRFEVWLSADDGGDPGPADLGRYIEIALAVDEKLARSKVAGREQLKAIAASSGRAVDQDTLRRILLQSLSGDLIGYRAIRCLNQELSNAVG